MLTVLYWWSGWEVRLGRVVFERWPYRNRAGQRFRRFFNGQWLTVGRWPYYLRVRVGG